MEERDANQDLEIDRDNLELEWQKQSHCYLYYARQSANAIEDQQLAKEEVDLLEAKLDGEIRTNPDDFGIVDKLTEKKVLSAIWQQEEYQKAKSKIIECTKTVNVLRGILTAFDHKKSALENLVKLFLSAYYSETKISDGAKGIVTDDINQTGANGAFRDD